MQQKIEKDQTDISQLQLHLSQLQEKMTDAETEVNRLKSTYKALLADLKGQLQKKDAKAAELKKMFEDRQAQLISLEKKICFKTKNPQREQKTRLMLRNCHNQLTSLRQ